MFPFVSYIIVKFILYYFTLLSNLTTPCLAPKFSHPSSCSFQNSPLTALYYCQLCHSLIFLKTHAPLCLTFLSTFPIPHFTQNFSHSSPTSLPNSSSTALHYCQLTLSLISLENSPISLQPPPSLTPFPNSPTLVENPPHTTHHNPKHSVTRTLRIHIPQRTAILQHFPRKTID